MYDFFTNLILKLYFLCVPHGGGLRARVGPQASSFTLLNFL